MDLCSFSPRIPPFLYFSIWALMVLFKHLFMKGFVLCRTKPWSKACSQHVMKGIRVWLRSAEILFICKCVFILRRTGTFRWWRERGGRRVCTEFVFCRFHFCLCILQSGCTTLWKLCWGIFDIEKKICESTALCISLTHPILFSAGISS